MTTITTKKLTAIKRLNDRLSIGIKLEKKISDIKGEGDLHELLKEYKFWNKVTSNVLRQLFSDSHLADEFQMNDDNILNVDKPIELKIIDTKIFIKNDNTKLEQVISDLKNDFYPQVDDKELKVAKLGLWQSIAIAIITALAGMLTGYTTSPDNTTEVKRQLGKLTLEGKWKYICTSFDGTYQHGGRFEVEKDKDGALFLVGERMWRDNYDTVTKTWSNIEFKVGNYLQWHTNWIFVNKNSEINFEYDIPTSYGNILGYCKGNISSNNGEVESVKGNFYVLNAPEILKGQIFFKKVSEEDFNSKQTLTKSH